MNHSPLPIGVEVHGHIVEIDVAHADDRDRVASVLRGFRPAPPRTRADARYRISRPVEGGWILERDDVMTHRAATIDDALLALEWQLVTDLLARPLGRFHLHGAALADPSATMTVLVCGESGSGKTTLTLALISGGFLPYTDDVILLEPERLTPVTFERAFHVDENTRRLVSTLDHDPDWEMPGLPPGYFLPRTWARQPLPVGALVFPRGRGVDRPLIAAMTVPEAATALLAASGSLDGDPALALKTAARLTAVAPAFSLFGGSLPSTLELVGGTIQRLVGARAPG